MTRIRLIIIFSLFSTLLFGQENFKKNNLFLEIGGNGLFTSINYERQLTKNPGLGLRLGIGYYKRNPFNLTIPMGVDYLLNIYKNKTFLDLGLGITYTKADVKLYVMVDYKDPNYVNENYLNIIPSLGFRFHTEKNIMWRISLTPVINHIGFIPFLGLSIGKLF